LPDVPTIAQAGVPTYEATSWNALFAPAGTPAAIVNRISSEVGKGLRQADALEALDAQGLDQRQALRRTRCAGEVGIYEVGQGHQDCGHQGGMTSRRVGSRCVPSGDPPVARAAMMPLYIHQAIIIRRTLPRRSQIMLDSLVSKARACWQARSLSSAELPHRIIPVSKFGWSSQHRRRQQRLCGEGDRAEARRVSGSARVVDNRAARARTSDRRWLRALPRTAIPC